MTPNPPENDTAGDVELLKPRRPSLIEMYEAERKERARRRELGLPLDTSKPVDRQPAHVHVTRPGIDMSIPEGERRVEREPGEEG